MFIHKLSKNLLKMICIILDFMINNELIIKILSLFQPGKINKKLKFAFILDGNRRYAKKMKISQEEGKKAGLNKLIKVINFLKHIDEMSVYAYSMQNFMKRNHEELDSIFKLAHEMKKDDLKCQIKFYGNIHLLSDEKKRFLNDLEKDTQKYEKKLNILLIYSGLDELKNENNKKIAKPDILIRTGYQKRLSDFMLYQCAQGTNITFIDVLWPEITNWHIYLTYLKYTIEQYF